MKNLMIVGVLSLLLMLTSSASFGQNLTPLEQVGSNLYFDTNLSTPPGQACASCHHPDAGFADPDQDLPVSQGALPNRFGNRNSPTAAYAAFSPLFHYDPADSLYVGGQFWDGRATDLIEQAKGPFLNILEMNNPHEHAVVNKVRRSAYAGLFEQVFGQGILRNTEAAYDSIAVAIAAFESTSELNKFTSKYDYYLLGQAQLTAQEALGLELFDDPEDGNCAACHPSTPGPYSTHALFTDFTYDNLGIPKNWENPFLTLPRPFNSQGMNFVDYGLGSVLGLEDEMGKFKVSTLRNIAATAPYGHNGFFETLTDIVDFYNTRDVMGAGWPPPEVPQNMNTEEMGDLGLTADEVAAIVAFLETLTDGYVPAVDQLASQPVMGVSLPVESRLKNVSPNPFNPTTTISYQLSNTSMMTLKVYDSSGRLVATLVDGWQNPGAHQVAFDASNLASGLYFVHLLGENVSSVQKMMFLK